MYSLIVKNCGQLLAMKGSTFNLIKSAFVACEGDKIVAVGSMKNLKNSLVDKKTKIIDAESKVVMPGLIDCHTHLVFAGSRANEFQRKLKGESYLDILKSGGGILSTVKATRKAKKSELVISALKHLTDMLHYGITTVEVKSGYGLDFKNEMKILEVVDELKKRQPIKLLKTFLGAHTVPSEYKGFPKKYLKFLMREVLPKLVGKVDFVDIFCEKGAFSLRQSRKYLKYAKSLGFKLKIHAEQLSAVGGCRMAAKLGATSFDHCDRLSARDIKKLAKFSSVAVLLPVVPLYTRENVYADGRKMIDSGLTVAVATDFNPGSAPIKNIYLAMSLACLKMGLTIEEVLSAVTINAARALDMQEVVGSIEKGKRADIVIMKAFDYREIPYFVGENMAEKVVVGGRVVVI